MIMSNSSFPSTSKSNTGSTSNVYEMQLLTMDLESSGLQVGVSGSREELRQA